MLRVNTVLAILIFASISGCLGGDESKPDNNNNSTFSENTTPAMTEEEIAQLPYDVRNFTVFDARTMENVTERRWSVYGTVTENGYTHNYGGNCCEHYLATDQDGTIYNFGGEWPWWSNDRCITWEEFKPPITTIQNPGEICVQGPVLTLDPGLGEGSIIQAPDGTIIAMGWFPYPGQDDPTGDQFYSFVGNKNEDGSIDWSWCENEAHEPFYDRSWQIPVIGPINPPANHQTPNCQSNCPWASIVVSNFWSYSTQGYQISVDGLNYQYLEIPDHGESGPADIEFALLDPEVPLGPEWDYMTPHREIRAVPVPASQGGGVLFPRWFDDGTNLYLDTNLQWHRHLLPGGLVFPSKYVSIDSSGAIHSISCNLANPSVNGCDGSFSLTHFLSLDGGLTWTNFTHLWPDATAVGNQATFEWDMQADGNLDLLVLRMRVQTARTNSAGGEGADVDLIYHIRGYRDSLEADTITQIGLGDLDAVSGAGNDIRFDFSSLAILPDGGVVVAYHDSTDEDPMFAIEIEIPEEYLVTIF